MSENTASASFIRNNGNFNHSHALSYNGSTSPKEDGGRSERSINEYHRNNFGRFDQMRPAMNYHNSDMWSNQPARYNFSGQNQNEYAPPNYGFPPKAAPEDFMRQGYPVPPRYKMNYPNYFSHSSPSPMVATDQKFMSGQIPLMQMTRLSESRHPSPGMPTSVGQGQSIDRPSSHKSSSMSSPKMSSKSQKNREQSSAKRSHQDNLSIEEVSMDSNASGSNVSRPAGQSRSETPGAACNLQIHSPAGSTNSRSNTPAVLTGQTGLENSSQSMGNQRIFSPSHGLVQQNSLMPPPMNPGMQGQGRVFSPMGSSNPHASSYYPPQSGQFHVPNFNRHGGPLMGPEQMHLSGQMQGGYPFPIHPASMSRMPPQQQYRMREPHFSEFRSYLQPVRMFDGQGGKMDGHPDFMRYQHPNFRPDFNYFHSRPPGPPSMYGQMNEYSMARPSPENFPNSHPYQDSNIPPSNSRSMLGGSFDGQSERTSIDASYSKHPSSAYSPHMSAPPPTSFSSPPQRNFNDEVKMSSSVVMASSTEPCYTGSGLSDSTRDSGTPHMPQKRSFDGEPVKSKVSDFDTSHYNQQQYQMSNEVSSESSNSVQQTASKVLGRSEDFDDQSSTQDTCEDSKPTSEPLVTDESSTSDTLLSYPGVSSQSQNENSNLDDSMSESPSKKLKLSKFPAEQDGPASMQDFSLRDNAFHLSLQRFGRNEAFCKFMEMGQEPDRRNFLCDLFSFMDGKQMPIITVPTVSKQPIDLFKLYCVVKKFGGMVEVTKNKKWRDISSSLNMGPSSSAGFVVKKNYGKFLFPFECFHDRGNIDPGPILAYLEQPIKKSSKKSGIDKEYLSSDPTELQGSPKVPDNFVPNRIPPMQGLFPSQPTSFADPMSSRYRTTEFLHNQPQLPNNSTFPSNASRYHNKFPPPGNPPPYDHFQMACQPPSSASPGKIDKVGVLPNKRVIGSHIHKELLFPSTSIESIRPKCVKRKRLNAKQIGSVDAWRILMSLKSGLMCETAWALNVLTGLLADDASLPWFCLQSLPGLVETLLDHFRASLIALFGCKFKDLELDWSVREEHLGGTTDGCKKRSASPSKNFDCEVDATTKRMKSKERIKVEKNAVEEMWLNDEKLWDVEGKGEFESSAFDWQLGKGDSTEHIFVNIDSTQTKDFAFQRFFGDKICALIHDLKNNSNSETCKEERKVEIKNELSSGKSEPELSTPVADVDQEANISNLISSNVEPVECGHKLCCRLFPDDRKVCLQSWVRSQYDDWYDTDVYGKNSKEFDFVPEAMYEQERRCMQLSNIFRSFSVVPGNDLEMAKHSGLLLILARLVMLGHEHKRKIPCCDSAPVFRDAESSCTYPKELDAICKLGMLYPAKHISDGITTDHCSKVIETLREDAMVILANISGQLDLSVHADEICTPVLDGLLHWATCYSASANDSNVAMSHPPSYIEPGNIIPSYTMLALETSSKLCILDSNVDLLMAMPPFSRIMLLLDRLCECLSLGAVGDELEEESMSWMSDQIAREFSLVILSSLVQADSSCAHLLALNRNFVGSILNFIEVQSTKMQLAASNSFLHSSGDCSPDMLKRAILVLHHVARLKNQDIDEKKSLLKYKDRLLDLLCHKLPRNSYLSTMISDVLSICSP